MPQPEMVELPGTMVDVAALTNVVPIGANENGSSAWYRETFARGTSGLTGIHALSVPEELDNTFGRTTGAEDEALCRSIKKLGVLRELLVTGSDCSSAPGTVLAGRRRLRAAEDADVNDVPTRVIVGLSRDEERRLMLADNLADTVGRRLSQAQKHQLELLLASTWTEPPPRRPRGPDFKGVAHNTSSLAPFPPPLKKRQRIAAALGEPTNAVANRTKIFASDASTPELRDAVEAGKVSMTRAAAIVRAAEKATTHRASPIKDEPAATDAARVEVNRLLAERAAAPRRPKQKGVCVEGVLNGVTYRLTTTSERLTLETRPTATGELAGTEPLSPDAVEAVAEAKTRIRTVLHAVQWMSLRRAR